LATFNVLFGQMLTFSIPLIILSFIIVGISDIGKSAGRMVLLIVTYAYCLTVLSGFLAHFALVTFQPLVVEIGSAVAVDDARDPVASLVNITVAPVMPIMTALVFAFIVGAFMVNLAEDNAIRKVAVDFRGIITQLIGKILVPLLPIHIAGIFARIAYQGQAEEMFFTFGRVFILILILHWVFLLVMYTIAGSLYKVSPFRLLKPMISSYMTAIGTQSSAATIPVNLINVKKLGVKSQLADFTVPLGASISLPGSTMSIVACTVAVMYMYNMDVSVGIIAPFIFGIAVAMVAAPGVPGGAIMASLGILEMTLGFTEVQLALMIALYIAQDSLGTAVNVTSDGPMTIFLNRLNGEKTLDLKV